jgi:hypothetical protein
VKHLLRVALIIRAYLMIRYWILRYAQNDKKEGA